jgi:hypothetical protein
MATDLATVHHFPPRIKFDQMPQLLKLRKGEFQSLGNAWDVLGFSKKRALWLFDRVLRYSYGIVMVYRCI